jgi:AcrR family transcriptional regulator
MVNGVADRPPRVDRRVMRTRKLIGDSLTSLLAGKSFESISVQDIAGRATTRGCENQQRCLEASL